MSGTHLGRYEILRPLAEGGMAEVLLGRASGVRGFARHVVIKRIRADHAHDQNFVRMLLDEARLVAALHHHNIVQVHDIGEEAGAYFFAMEYVHGADLLHLIREIVQRGELMPLEHAMTIIAGAAAGLHYAHEQRGADGRPLDLVHRDVSPSNILVGYDGSVRITDFGIAKAAQRSVKTRSGALKGKISYMSPEQCMGRTLDRRSDIFGLGIVLYEMATGRRLFKAETDFMTMSAIVHGKIPPAASLRADLPPELTSIITKALAAAPIDRFQTAGEMGDALEAFATSARIRTSTLLLADYVTAVLGVRREPWLLDPAELAPDIAEDETISGVVRPPEDSIAATADAETSSPIVAARTEMFPLVSVESLSGELAVTTPQRRAEPRRRRVWVIGGVAIAVVAAAVAVVIALLPAPSLEPAAATQPAPAPVEHVSAPVASTPAAAPPAPTPPIVTPPVIVAAPPPPVPKPKVAAKPRPPQPKQPETSWDPNGLFPQ